jgi:hypothetical protein
MWQVFANIHHADLLQLSYCTQSQEKKLFCFAKRAETEKPGNFQESGVETPVQ